MNSGQEFLLGGRGSLTAAARRPPAQRPLGPLVHNLVALEAAQVEVQI